MGGATCYWDFPGILPAFLTSTAKTSAHVSSSYAILVCTLEVVNGGTVDTPTPGLKSTWNWRSELWESASNAHTEHESSISHNTPKFG